jgi:hypothetical protein
MRIFERWYTYWLVLKFEISYRVIIIAWWIFGFVEKIFGRLYFCMVKYLSFHNSSFCLKILFNVNGKATVCDTPLAIYPLSQGIFLLPRVEPFFVIFFSFCQSSQFQSLSVGCTRFWIGSKGFRFRAPGFSFQASGFEFWGKGFIYFLFQAWSFFSEHTWNQKPEMVAWNWMWKHLNIIIWIF